MAQGGKNAVITSYIDNVEYDAPINWQSINVLAFFDNKGVQADITTTTWEFAGEAAKRILELRDLNGRFQGIPFKLTASNDNTNLTTFDGYIDPTDGFINTFDDDQKIKVNMKKKNGLNVLNDRLGAVYLDYLESIGVFTANDYTVTNYIVQKKVTLVEQLMAAIMIFQMVKELKELIKEISEFTLDTTAHTTGGISGPVAGVIFAIAGLVIQIVYAIAISIAIIKLTKQLIDTLIPPQRKHRCLKLRTGLEKISTHLGYEFISNIPELDTYHYLPSNPQLEKPKLLDFLTKNVGVKKGIPNTVDYGNNAADFFGLASDLFNARIALSDNQLFFYTDDDPFWTTQSTWSLPSARPRPVGDNSGDLKGSRLFSFDTDLNDRYTVDRYKGTSYQIITDLISVVDPKAKCIKGNEEIDFKVCLPTRKDSLTELELTVYSVKQVVLNVFSVLTGTPPINFITSIVSSMIQSDNWHSKPKILVLNGSNALPKNHRDLISAKYLYHKYHESDSFVANNFYGQKFTYAVPKIGFGLEDYVELNENSFFNDEEGGNGKMVKIDWTMGKDNASVDYWIRGIYDPNLKETFIEPEN